MDRAVCGSSYCYGTALGPRAWEATHSSLTELGLHITATSRTPCNADGLAGAEAALVQCWRYFVCSAEQRRLLTFMIGFHSHTLRALCNSRGTDEGTTHWRRGNIC